jgi:PAS domain S-box-containing protein
MSRGIVKLLRKTSIFSFLDPTNLNRISEFFKEQTYDSEHVFFRDDAVNDILYIIKRGAVNIIKTGKSGEGKLSLTLRREGDFFGETALIEETSGLETAQAIKETTVLQLSRSNFLTIVSNYPFVAFQIMKALTSRLRQSYLGLIEDLGEKDEELKKAQLESSEGVQLKEIQPPGEQVSFSDEIISTSPFSTIATKEDGTIFIFNKTAEKEYGYSSEEVVGKGIDLLKGEGNLSNLDQLIKQTLKDKGVWKGEIIAKRKNGERFVSDTTVYTIADPKSNKPAILWVGRDITLERVLTREASEKEKLLNTGERMREVALNFDDQVQLLSENLDILTHEAKQSDLPQSQARVKAMKDALENLKGIIFPLASFPSLKSVKEPVDLANFIEKELLFVRLQKRFMGINFITKYDDKLPLVDSDPQQMRQLLTDLLDNAAFALSSVSDREKTITMEVKYLARDEEIELQVLDNGVGISEDDLPKVFKEHFTTKGKGFGFGLFSVKRAVEGHGGTIEVQSVEGAYTLFTIRFPAKMEVSIQKDKPSLVERPLV